MRFSHRLLEIILFALAVGATSIVIRLLSPVELTLAQMFMELDGTIAHPFIFEAVFVLVHVALLIASIVVVSLVSEKFFGLRMIRGTRHITVLFLCVGLVTILWELFIRVPVHSALYNVLERSTISANQDQNAQQFFVVSRTILSWCIWILGFIVQYVAFKFSFLLAKSEV